MPGVQQIKAAIGQRDRLTPITPQLKYCDQLIHGTELSIVDAIGESKLGEDFVGGDGHAAEPLDL